MNPLHQVEKLAKLAAYMLGRHPDEFGLVLDFDGYIAIKELLKAVNELEGWKHIRQFHLHEVILSARNPAMEVNGSRVRANTRDLIPIPVFCSSPPKLLYTCIRPKAHFAAAEHGLRPMSHPFVICAREQDLAEKIGKRRDQRPVLLTIHAIKATGSGVKFHQYGDVIFLADFIPPDCFTGPPLPKEKPQEKPSDSIDLYRKQAHAGSFEWSPEQADLKIHGKKKGMNWKKDKKRLRREKENLWP
ncbi:MAG: RNA 2'-phosphotransferase [Desulfobacterales bacterium]|nr:RNA 2'-phosphotransferase [Desulfobacterales bacterium]